MANTGQPNTGGGQFFITVAPYPSLNGGYTVFGEIISGQYGIGYFTWNAYSVINYPDIVVGMLIIGLLGASSTALVRLLTRPALAWQRKAR